MQAVIDACRAGRLAASPVVVISNNIDSGRWNVPVMKASPVFT